MAVDTIALGACNRGYSVTDLSDCTASTDPELHRKCLQKFEDYYGAVKQSSELDL